MNESMTKVLWSLRTPQSGCGDLRLSFDGIRLLAEYEYRDSGKDWIGVVAFDGIIAYRYRNELHSQGFAPSSLDTIVELQDSPWLASLREIEPPGVWGVQGKRHFAVFFSSNGYLEVIAASCEERDGREGLLAALTTS